MGTRWCGRSANTENCRGRRQVALGKAGFVGAGKRVLVGDLYMVSRHHAERNGSDDCSVYSGGHRIAGLSGVVVTEQSDEAETRDSSGEPTTSSELRV